ncbi:unnamed protein product [Lathyrus sativus]|nr:unnamed protein product [Lathyrus sativus]
MVSKRAILIVGLLAIALLISSEVSARELTEEIAEKSNELNDAKFLGFHRHHHRHDHRHGHRHHHGRHGVDSDNGN